MLITTAGLVTKLAVGAAAVALTGAGAVATISATGAAAASNPVSGSSVPDDSTTASPSASESPEHASPEATTEATHEAGDDNGVDPTTAPSNEQAALTRDQAIAIAQARFPAGSVHGVELEREHGVLVWKVDLRAADGSRAKIWVDASTGTIVRERTKAARHHGKPATTPAPAANGHHDGADDNAGSGSGSSSGSKGGSGSGRGGHDDAPNHA